MCARSSEQRRGRKRAAIALAIGALTFAASAPPAAAGGDRFDGRTRLVAVAGGKAARVPGYGYCLDFGEPGSPMGHECADVTYDPHPPRLFRIGGGSTVVLCAGHAAAGMRLWLNHDSPTGATVLTSLRARSLDSSHECWSVRLPRVLGTATSFEVRVSYGTTGDAHFLAGLSRDD